MTMPTGEQWMRTVAEMVHRDLEAFFESKTVALRELAPSAEVMLDEIRALTLRGGKRLRATLVAGGFRAARDSGELEPTAALGSAVELLQTALLIHDDWMDQDVTRRGGPAVHASLRDRFGDTHRGDSVGILAGDYATSLAFQCFMRAPFPPARRDEALRAYGSILEEVYLGQYLDITGDEDVSRMHRLKTTSYTVLGPLRLGALLGDVSDETSALLERWAIPIGEAFQIRDDLLGTLGDPSATGKPGDDLRHGKRTALLHEARSTGSSALLAMLDRVVGRPDATDDEVSALIEALVAEEVVARVERRLDACVETAQGVLRGSSLSADRKADFEALGEKLGRRSA
jgi:geranylgeranyl diphosphate synthase, type I